MKKTILAITFLFLFFGVTSESSGSAPLTDVEIKNTTGVTLAIWVEYYLDDEIPYSRKATTKEVRIPPGGYSMFAVSVGLITLHAEATNNIDPATGTYYHATKSFQRNNPGPGKKPHSIYWGIRYEDLKMDPSIRERKVKNFSGKWDCGKAILNIEQNGNTLEGEISGNAAEHEWIKVKGGGTISGEVNGKDSKVADIYIEFPDGYYMKGKNFRLRKEENYMSGLDPIFTPANKYSSGGAVVLRCNRIAE